MRKIVAIVLFLIGGYLFCTPFINNAIYEKQQQRLLTEWKHVSTPVSKKPALKSLQPLLEIDKISLEMPILEGSSPEHLKQSVATINPNQTPGKGNYTIAGHRSFTYGKQFNRLNELEKGDIVILKTKEKSYEYIVSRKFLVEPTDVSVLDTNKRDPEITLVTCDPAENPTHRLIVRGVLKSGK